MTLTATTTSPAEFFQVMEWCQDHGLRQWCQTRCHGGFHVIEVTLAVPDWRFLGFAKQVTHQAAWETHLGP